MYEPCRIHLYKYRTSVQVWTHLYLLYIIMIPNLNEVINPIPVVVLPQFFPLHH